MDRLSYAAPTSRFSHYSAFTPPSLTSLQRFESNLSLQRTPSQFPDVVKDYDSNKCHVEVPVEKATWQPGTRFYLAFSALAALSLVVALDGTSISVALPTIGEELGGSAIDTFWAGTSFLLSSAVFQPIIASFSCIYGRKLLTLTTIVVFLAGTLIAGTAPNMLLMLVGRSVQGIGAGGIMSMTSILVTDLVPLRHRGTWLGVLGAMWAIGSVSGPVIGGALAHKSTWPWIFYLNVPFIGAGFIMVALFIRLKQVPLSLWQKLQRTDFVGSVMFGASMTSILIPMTWGGIQYEWHSWRVIAPLGFGILGLITLGYHEILVAEVPIIPKVVFGNRTTNIAYLTTGLQGLILWSLLYYQPLYFEGVRGTSPVMSGVALFPASFTVAPLAIVTGIFIEKLGHFRWAVWCGWMITAAGVWFLTLVNVHSGWAQILITDFCTGIGIGCLFPALQFQLQSSAGAKHVGAAVAMFAFFHNLGQTLGVAIAGNVFQNALSSRLSEQPLFADRANALAKDATGMVHWLRGAPDGEAKLVMRTAITDSIRVVYIVMGSIALFAALVSFFIRHYDLDQALETEQGMDVEDDARSLSSEYSCSEGGMKELPAHWRQGSCVGA